MKKSTIIIFAVASLVALLGAALVAVGFALGAGFNRYEFHETTYDAEGYISCVDIDVSFAELTIKSSENGRCYAICEENEKLGYSLSLNNGTLSIVEKDLRKWFDYISIGTYTSKLELYLPKAEYSELSVKTSSGKISCQSKELVFLKASLSSASGAIDFCADVKGELKASSSSGRICLSQMTPTDIIASSSSGKTELADVVALNKIDVSTSSGNVCLNRCDAESMKIQTSSGRVEGTLLSDKIFDVKTSSGSIDCPPSIKDSGMCKIITSSGNVKINIAEDNQK